MKLFLDSGKQCSNTCLGRSLALETAAQIAASSHWYLYREKESKTTTTKVLHHASSNSTEMLSSLSIFFFCHLLAKMSPRPSLRLKYYKHTPYTSGYCCLQWLPGLRNYCDYQNNYPFSDHCRPLGLSCLFNTEVSSLNCSSPSLYSYQELS